MRGFIVNKQFIHLYSGCEIQSIVKSPDRIAQFKICSRGKSSTEKPGLLITVVTFSNDIFLAELPDHVVTESSQSGVADNDNQEIFTELLDQEGGDVQSPPKVLHLDSSHLVFQSSVPIECIDVVGGLLLTLTGETPPRMKAYKLDGDGEGERKAMSPCLDLECPSVQLSSTQDRHGLFAVVADEDNNHWTSTAVVRLPKALFASFFGSTAALLDSPILLYALNGYVFHKQLMSTSGDEKWNVFCVIEGSVENALRIQIQPSKNERDAPFTTLAPQNLKCYEGMLICSSIGKSMLVHKCSADGSVVYEDVVLQGRVVCCESDGTRVYHCTGQHIYKNTLEEKDVLGSHDCINVKSEVLHQVWTTNMVMSSGNSPSDDVLLCQSDNGEILSLKIDNDEHIPDQGVKSVKELLKRLDVTNREHDSIQDKQKSINDVLRQVSIASYLLSPSAGKGKTRPVTCNCAIESVKNGYSREYTLVTKLTNHNAVALSPDWTIMVVFETRNQSDVETRSHSMVLSNGLASKSSFKMRIPLESAHLLNISLNIRVYLVLYSHILEDEEAFKHHYPIPESSRSSISVPVGSQELDALFFLSEPIAESVGVPIPSLDQSLLTLAQRQTVKKTQLSAMETHSQTGQLYLITIHVGRINFPADFEQTCLKEDTLAIKLLKYLLKDAQVPSEVITKSQLQLVNPHGHLISVSMVTDPFGVQVGSERVDLLAWCRIAIVQRLEAISVDGQGGVSVEDLGKYRKQMESLREDLHVLDGKLSPDPSSDDSRKDLASVYEKLRKIHL